LDGAEVQESVFTLLFLDRAGAKVQCFAPDTDQMHVVDHKKGEPTGETRNVLVESARIARGAVEDIKNADMGEFDALVMPGGFGVAKNLSEFATKGPDGTVNPDVLRLVGESVKARKPIVAICISPAVLAAALKQVGSKATLTIGNDSETAGAIESLGSHHQDCPVNEAVVDEEHRIISTPAYMLGPGPKGVAAGIEQSIGTLMRWLS
jgi:enhancing lycopene biosynthesis protein 2